MKSETINFDNSKQIISRHKPSGRLIAFSDSSFDKMKEVGWAIDYSDLEEPKELEGVLLTFDPNKKVHELIGTSKIKTSIAELEPVIITTIY